MNHGWKKWETNGQNGIDESGPFSFLGAIGSDGDGTIDQNDHDGSILERMIWQIKECEKSRVREIFP